jgi:acyl carrier protein
MQDADIYAKLTLVFREVFDGEVTLTPETTADDVEGWDSLQHVRLMLAVSKAFNVKFSASALGGLKNVRDLVELIKVRSGS